MTDHRSEVKLFADGSSVAIEYYEGVAYKEYWYNKEKVFHRENGLPAIIGKNGYEVYYKH